MFAGNSLSVKSSKDFFRLIVADLPMSPALDSPCSQDALVDSFCGGIIELGYLELAICFMNFNKILVLEKSEKLKIMELLDRVAYTLLHQIYNPIKVLFYLHTNETAKIPPILGQSKLGLEPSSFNILDIDMKQISLREDLQKEQFENIGIKTGTVRIFDGMEFVYIEPGKVMDCRSDSGEPYSIEQKDGFWIGRYPVTQKDWQRVMGPCNWPNVPPLDDWGIGSKYPMYNVSWHNAQNFISTLNNRYYVSPYKMDSGLIWQGRFPGYRLPTEMEWEYACRAGSNERYPWGSCNEDSIIAQHAWYNQNSDVFGTMTEGRAGVRPVGMKPPNSWGLYDMLGNVWEWCLNHCGHSAQKLSSKNQMPRYALRGGSWGEYKTFLSYSCHDSYPPGYWNVEIGFRIIFQIK
jgi:formylglycine-generating enzyme required for sulfatase activity